MNLYKILEYTDEGLGDRSVVLMYTKGDTPEEAKPKYSEHIKDSSIMKYGFIIAYKISYADYSCKHLAYLKRRDVFKILK